MACTVRKREYIKSTKTVAPQRIRWCEAEPLFELFYRKAAPLHSVSIEMTEFTKNLTKDVFLKNGKMFHKKTYSGSHFRHGISHKSCVSSFPYSSSNLAGAL